MTSLTNDLPFIMRLEKEKALFLKEKIQENLSDATVFLFGSRTDDTKKGGDIDILVLGTRKLKLNEKLNVQTAFWKQFGMQKLDLVSFTFEDDDPFKRLILLDAIEL